MSIQYVKGDLFHTSGITAYAHGCNCAGAMGKGIAVEFKNKWPSMYLEYKKLCAKSEFLPGDVFVWNEGETTIFNLGTQKSWRSNARPEFVYESLKKMLQLAESSSIKQIGMPRIGAGLGGLSWESVKHMLEELAGTHSVNLIIFEQFVQNLEVDIGSLKTAENLHGNSR